jgi:hypothetical protein
MVMINSSKIKKAPITPVLSMAITEEMILMPKVFQSPVFTKRNQSSMTFQIIEEKEHKFC